jgi:hypothetical protein
VAHNGEGFLRSAVYPMHWMRLMMMYCGMAVKRMSMLGICVRKMRAQTVKLETLTLTFKGRYNLTHLVY